MCFWNTAIVRTRGSRGGGGGGLVSLLMSSCSVTPAPPARARIRYRAIASPPPVASRAIRSALHHALLARQPFLVLRLLVHAGEQLVRGRIVRINVDRLLRILHRVVHLSG